MTDEIILISELNKKRIAEILVNLMFPLIIVMLVPIILYNTLPELRDFATMLKLPKQANAIFIQLLGLDMALIGLWAVITGYLRIHAWRGIIRGRPTWDKEPKSLYKRIVGLIFLGWGICIALQLPFLDFLFWLKELSKH